MKRKILLTILLTFVFLAVHSPVFAVTWSSTTIQSTGTKGTMGCSIASTSGNDYIVVYYDQGTDDLYFAKSTDDGDTWTPSAIETTNNVGGFPNIAVDNSGNYIVAYYDATNFDLRFAKSTNSGSSWTPSTIDSTGSVGGGYMDIAVDGSNNYLITYRDSTNNDLKFAKSTDGGDSWTTSVIDATTAGDNGSSIAVDGSGNYIVSYQNNGSSDLKFAKSVNGGSSWSTSTVYSTGTAGAHSSIAVDSSGNYLIAFNTAGWKVAFAKSTNGGDSWSTAEVYTDGGAAGAYNALVVDDDDNYMITHLDQGVYGVFATYSTNGGSSWSTEAAYEGGEYIDETNALALDQNNNYIGCFGDLDNNDIEFLLGTNAVPDTTAPSISLSAGSDPTSDTTPALTGTATEAAGTVSAVQFQMDGTGGSWSACTADDGTYDEASEAFTCTVSSPLSDGSHTMYVRATDNSANTTASDSYSSDTFVVDATGPIISSVSASKTSTAITLSWTTDEASSTLIEYGPTTSYGTTTTETDTSPRVTSHTQTIFGLTACTTYHIRPVSEDALSNSTIGSDIELRTNGCASSSSSSSSSATSSTPQISALNGGRTVTSVQENLIGSHQTITSIIESGTVAFNAYFSSTGQTAQDVNNIVNFLLPPAGGIGTSLPSQANFVAAGGGAALGIKTTHGIAWQVGSIQKLHLRATPASGNKLGPVIIPELQSKPSIIALTYTALDLVPPGNPTTTFAPSALKLARSIDGITWTILETSVVDEINKTVAAIDKIYGYYLIVAAPAGSSGFSPPSANPVLGITDGDAPTELNQPAAESKNESTPQPANEKSSSHQVIEPSEPSQPSLLYRIVSFVKDLF